MEWVFIQKGHFNKRLFPDSITNHEWRNGWGLGSQWDQCDLGQYIHIQHPRRTPDIHWKDLWRPRQGKDGMYPAACTQNDDRHDCRGIHGQLWDAHQKDQLQQSSPRGCLHPRTPSIHPFEGLLSDIPPIWHGQLEGSCVQPRLPPKKVCWTETVNLSKLNTIPPDEHPSYHPSTGYLNAYGHRQKQVQTRNS